MRTLILAALAAILALSPVRAEAGPGIRTDQAAYLAGDPVSIFGDGFSPYENVALLVGHANGVVEAGAGHEWFFVNADSNGAFRASWSISRYDAAGTKFTVAAAGASGSRAQTSFDRIGFLVSNRPSYQPGERARIRGKGFNPNELVVLRANDGHDHELMSTLTDANGIIDVTVDLPADYPDLAFVIKATAEESSLALTLNGSSLGGRILYHSYVSYGDGTSQMFMLDLVSGALTNLSSGWTNLKDPMNGHWSPDGSKIVFMARPRKAGNKYSAFFDIFLYTPGQPGNPVNLTNTGSLHDEDPKFSPDGTKIVYKVRPSTLKEMDLYGNVLNTIISSSGESRSMPYYTADGSAVWFSAQSAQGPSVSSIHKINVNGANDTLVVDTTGAQDYYPIRDTVGEFIYTRGVSADNRHDQAYMFDGVKPIALPFNTLDADYSDAFPVNTQYIVLSSTRAGGAGGYDLYIADRATGAVWPLTTYNAGVNTSRQDLGAAYTPTN